MSCECFRCVDISLTLTLTHSHSLTLSHTLSNQRAVSARSAWYHRRIHPFVHRCLPSQFRNYTASTRSFIFVSPTRSALPHRRLSVALLQRLAVRLRDARCLHWLFYTTLVPEKPRNRNKIEIGSWCNPTNTQARPGMVPLRRSNSFPDRV